MGPLISDGRQKNREKYLSHTLHAKTTLETRNRIDIADAKRLSFRLSTELPRHFLLYFNKNNFIESSKNIIQSFSENFEYQLTKFDITGLEKIELKFFSQLSPLTHHQTLKKQEVKEQNLQKLIL